MQTALEPYLKNIIDQAAVGIVIRDMEGRWLHANKALRELLGYGEDEILNQTGRHLTTPEERADAIEWNRKIQSGEIDTYTREKHYLHKNGASIFVEVTITAIRDDAGKPKLLVTVLKDLTARQQAAAEARASEARFRAAFEQAAVGMAIRGMDRRFIRVNKKLCEFLGYEEAELLNIASLDVTPPEDRGDAIALQERISDGSIDQYSREKRYLRKDGKIVWANVAFTVVRDAQGAPLHLVAVIEDISARKNAELELVRYRENLEALVKSRTDEFERAKTAAEYANRAKSTFLSNISHELRTPLNAILGFSQLMDDGSTGGGLGPEHREWLNQIMKAGWHLLELVDEVLDFGKIEAGRMDMELEAVPVADIVRAAISLGAPQAATHEITVAPPEVAAGVDCVRADPVRLKQVLLNLLSNAVKYNVPQGRVRVHAQTHANNRVAISVIDSGFGLTPEQRQTLFTPFSRHVPKGRVIEGAGIGLALTKSLVELMGGTITVQSVPGQGSTFTVTLPVAERQNSDPMALTQEIAPAGVSRLLCVEDNPTNMEVVRAFIRNRTQFEFLGATTGESGLAMARTKNPDLILLDINLPDMSGFDVMRALRQDAATRDIPIVALSANATADDIARGRREGCVEYLTKPVRLDRLLECVNKHKRMARAVV